MVRNNDKESGLRYWVCRCVRAGRMQCLRGVYELGLVTALLLACKCRYQRMQVYSSVGLMAKVRTGTIRRFWSRLVGLNAESV